VTTVNGGKSDSLHTPEKFLFFNIRLFQDRQQGADSQFRMVGDSHKAPRFRVHKMNVAAGLPYCPEPESRQHFDNVMS